MKNSFLTLWEKYRFNSIAVRNALKLFMVFLLVMVIPMLIVYHIIIGNAQRQAAEENASYTKKLSASTEILFRDAEYLAAEILSDPDMVFYLTAPADKVFDEQETENIQKRLKAYSSGKILVDSIYLYSQTNDLICSAQELKRADEFADISWLEAYTGEAWGDYKIISRSMDNKYSDVFTLIKKSSNNRGAVVINIDLLKMEKYVAELKNPDASFYIINNNGVMYSNGSKKQDNGPVEAKVLEMIRQGKAGTMFRYGGDMISVESEQSAYYNWYYARSTVCREYQRTIVVIYCIAGAVILLFLVFAVLFSVFLSVDNVSRLVGIFDLVEDREKYKSLNDNEMTEIANRILLLIDDNSNLKAEISRRTLQYEEYKIKALQTQITPHFLNNTLAVINFEVIDQFGYDTSVSPMISKLSQLLKYTMISDKMLVQLREEFAFITVYTELLKYRYGSFEMEIAAPEALQSVRIVRMCLQPLVENAIFYGLRETGGRVVVRGWEEDDKIMISVEDNGKGIDPQTLCEILASFENEAMLDRHIGLKNVYMRIKAVYGEKGGMKIESEPGEYTKIILYIPKSSAERNEP